MSDNTTSGAECPQPGVSIPSIAVPGQNVKPDLVNYVFTWSQGGNEVLLIGSFSKWIDRIPMQKSGGNEFLCSMKLERAQHQYKFIVDGNWRFASD
jgi:5'-AMP-activated protein kinase regulatory beta subunit